jgi:hypothetical protein
LLANRRGSEALILGRCAMELMDLLIDAEATHVDWCTDPADLERALARRLSELEARDDLPTAHQEKLAQLKLVRELGRITQH